MGWKRSHAVGISFVLSLGILTIWYLIKPPKEAAAPTLTPLTLHSTQTEKPPIREIPAGDTLERNSLMDIPQWYLQLEQLSQAEVELAKEPHYSPPQKKAFIRGYW